ncbi:hypothetical protein [Phenylobacterium sp.]|uniref:phage fiber-tail adaptor protein n=1 Tax=Phenylobacterium sp. TaxID=1871053 RepID=UPI0035B0DAEB
MKTGFDYSPAGWWIYKDPNADLGYGCQWADWLTTAAGDTIVTSTWSASPDGLTLSDDPTKTRVVGTVAMVWISGGQAGVDYTVTNHVETEAGDKDDRSFIIRCRER